jgi:thioredoxin reductase (NADPH)
MCRESGQMKTGIIGVGKLGTDVVGRLIKMGHAVMLSFSGDLERRRRLLSSHTRRSPALPGKRDRGRRQFRGTGGAIPGSALKHVHLLVSRPLETKSRYLIRRIEESPSITLRPYTEVEAIEGNGGLEKIRWRNSKTSEVEVRDIRHLYPMTGASPNTSWLQRCVALDSNWFIKTGTDLGTDDLSRARSPLRRLPFLLETSLPRVFAVGRSLPKRQGVASAVGEGSISVHLVHKVLQE